ncbi:histone acetyltransferases subunit 3-domain-containing protein [Elsinoe ampelina]|uniref:Histone acetyltransferases subunit 3-domain-containing protein n=1 Tax=Elsinoe ampelina TaxID=302913 RepID=A0A6A6GAB9_9PEZI|nr:histone acetyltransferases subunit 3-domain-containing protein [Elsinoe ampelina]
MPGPQGSKSKNGNGKKSRDRRSQSRNTTPLSSGTETSSGFAPITGETPYLRTALASLLVPPHASIEALIEKHSSGSSNPPSVAALNNIHDGIQSSVIGHVTTRGTACDGAMRQLARKRKERVEFEREREERERMDEDRRRRDAKKIVGKKRDREEMEDETRPPAVGAHGLARQDGVDVHMEGATQSPPPKAEKIDAGSPSGSSEASHQPPPAQPVAQYQSFGDDPTQYDDPTVYDIRDVTPDMTEDEKKAILSVADYPHDDLHDLTPGTPPDMDFSNAKPSNQVAFSTFISYIEPYVRPLTEEDVAFLKERGDRVEPFMMPVRGPMPYREVWAREDGHNPRDPMNDHLPQNAPRGSIEDMNDETAATEEISGGPLLARLLSIFRHEPSVQKDKDKDDTAETNGDISMVNGDATAGEQEASHGATNEDSESFKPATYFADMAGNSTNKPPIPSPRPFATLEQRMLQELRYHGLLTPESTPDYDGHFDDEVAARLRYLQSELRTVMMENGARKARVLELTEERMAMQEYATIADDLDNQINAAYTKRNRTMGKPKKGTAKQRPGQAAGLAISRNNISEGVRMLMDRRLQWRDLIGPVVEFGHKGIPKETVFDKTTMERLVKAEGEAGDAEDV